LSAKSRIFLQLKPGSFHFRQPSYGLDRHGA
jgi:hypothetical protein